MPMPGTYRTCVRYVVIRPEVTPIKYAKTVVAALVAVLTALYAAVTDNTVTAQEWVTIALAALTAVGVYLVPNKPTTGKDPRHSD